MGINMRQLTSNDLDFLEHIASRHDWTEVLREIEDERRQRVRGVR